MLFNPSKIEHIRYVGFLCLFIGFGAWMVDWFDLVYNCPYCRAQRSVIFILGLFLVLPSRPLLVKYLACVLAFFGAGVAMMQHFNGWKKINSGTFEFNDQIYLDPFLLSGFALFIIIGELFLIMHSKDKA